MNAATPAGFPKANVEFGTSRYWEHLIRDENDSERHVDYIHYNPIKHGYIHQASEWPYSKAFTVYQGWRNHK